jgi:hypothetical protein
MPEINLNDCEVRTAEVNGTLLKMFSCPNKSGYAFDYQGKKYGRQYSVDMATVEPANIVLDHRENDARLHLNQLLRGQEAEPLSAMVSNELEKVGIAPASEQPTSVFVIDHVNKEPVGIQTPVADRLWDRGGKRLTKEDIQAAHADPLNNK